MKLADYMRRHNLLGAEIEAFLSTTGKRFAELDLRNFEEHSEGFKALLALHANSLYGDSRRTL